MATLYTEFEICQENIDLCDIITNGILATWCSLSALCILVMTSTFIKARFDDQNPRSSLFYATLLFFFFCLCAEVSQTALNILQGHNFALLVVFYNIFVQFYMLEYIVLMGILYGRLNAIFKSSDLQLSKVTKVIFSVVYIFTIIVLVTGALLWVNQSSFQPPIMAIMSLCILSLSIFLVFLFIHKLYKVYIKTKCESCEANTRMITAITKSSLLGIISTSITIIAMVFNTFSKGFNPGVHIWLIRGFVSSADVTSNALCIWLLFKSFERPYAILCGKCDNKCRQLWTNCAGKTDSVILGDIVSNSQTATGSMAPDSTTTAATTTASTTTASTTTASTATASTKTEITTSSL